MTADRITDALDLLARAVETHDGAPADTNLARAQVLATIAVAEQLAELTQAITRVYPPAPAPDTAGGQAETAPEETAPTPRLMLDDLWSDDSDDEWTVIRQDGRLLLTWDGETRTWESADDEYGPLRLVRRAGCRRTTDTVPVWQLKLGQVVSHPDWCDGAPVRSFEALGDVRDLKIVCRPLGWISKVTFPAARDAEVTLWDEIAGDAR